MNIRNPSLAVLAAGGLLSVASAAHAETVVYDFSGFAPPQSVDIDGAAHYDYGFGSDMKSRFSSVSAADYVGSYTEVPTDPASDSYSSGNITTYTPFGGAGYPGDSYLNLMFSENSSARFATAKFETQSDGDVFLDSITVQSAAPEPAAWTLLIAGVGLAGAAQRRRRRQESLAA